MGKYNAIFSDSMVPNSKLSEIQLFNTTAQDWQIIKGIHLLSEAGHFKTAKKSNDIISMVSKKQDINGIRLVIIPYLVQKKVK